MDSRALLSRDRLLLLAVALLPGAAIVYFSFNDGGYFPGPVALVAAELALLLALRFAVARVPWEGFGVALTVAAVALGFFAAWTLASQGWSHSPSRAMAEYDRALLYVLTLVFFGSLAFSVTRMRWMLYGAAVAIVGVCGAAFVARTLPEVIYYQPTIHEDRLSYPLSYWNSLGIFAAIGIVLCGHLACSTRDRWPARILGAAAVPMLATVLFATFSRGATWAAVGAVVVYVVLGRPRGLLSGAIATVPTTAVALMTINPVDKLVDRPLSETAVSHGHRVALTVGLCVLAAGVLRGLMLPLDRWLDSLTLPERARRPVLAGATATVAVVVLAGCAALQVPDVASEKYDEFTSSDANVGGAGSSRLFEASSNGRQGHWDVAKAAYRANRGRGTGAGTYALEWNQHRAEGLLAQDGHSLYYEVLGELGLPGMIALGLGLLLILGAFLVRARGPDRALFAALFAAGLAWAVHAGIDWDWEMPAVTFSLFAFGGAALAVNRSRLPAPRAIGLPVKAIVVIGCALLAIIPLRMALSEGHVNASLDALRDGDCRAATAEARDARAIVDERPAPYQVIGFCAISRGKPVAGVKAFTAAARRDPENWELRYELAVARGLAGRDPRPQARLAWTLNPLEELTQDAVKRFRGKDRASWTRAASYASLPVPGAPTP